MKKLDAANTKTDIGASSCLVLKRGHHGRFRFAMLTSEGRVSGEVRVNVAGGDRAIMQTHALDEISSLARSLTVAVAGRIAASSFEEVHHGPESKPIQRSLEIEETIEGAHHGEV